MPLSGLTQLHGVSILDWTPRHSSLSKPLLLMGSSTSSLFSSGPTTIHDSRVYECDAIHILCMFVFQCVFYHRSPDQSRQITINAIETTRQ